MLNVGMCNCETILLSLCSCLFACDIRVAIVGGQEQKYYSPPGTKLYFHVNSVRKNSIVSTRNMAALFRGCKPRVQYSCFYLFKAWSDQHQGSPSDINS